MTLNSQQMHSQRLSTGAPINRAHPTGVANLDVRRPRPTAFRSAGHLPRHLDGSVFPALTRRAPSFLRSNAKPTIENT
jgi:hypothetical protein